MLFSGILYCRCLAWKGDGRRVHLFGPGHVIRDEHTEELELTPDIKDIPARIAQAFNAVRYGDHLLTPEQTDRLGQDVVLLTSAISTTNSRPRK